MIQCNHDYKRAERVGRARYICPKCNQDISLTVILIAEAEQTARYLKQQLKEKNNGK